ncbi:phosphatase PAP2 family protein [Streptomyces sp. NPDC079020]|uniref:phosphatase PAP2 family protein n=1 Tax=Streptomyces sp. NPDC079020 TaxID=3365722 RepID=UPI0037D31F41
MHTPSPYRPGRSRTAPRALRTACIGVCLAALLMVLVVTRWSPLMSLDRTIAEELHRHAVNEPGLVQLNRVLTDWVWDPWTMRALVAVVVIGLWWHGARLLAGWVAATSLVSTLVQQGLKAAVGRERPKWPDPVDSAHYAAFPSGHVMTAVVTCGLLLWLLRVFGAGPRVWRGALVVAGVSVAGVGFTRIYLGVHWMTDVLEGVLLGVAVVAFSIAGHQAWTARTTTGAAAPRQDG